MLDKVKPIPGWPKYYCDQDGNVFSCKGKGGVWRKLTPKLANSGYHGVHLRHDGRETSMFVHRAVLLAWVGPKDGHEGNHKNGDRLDNRLANLEWVTPKENQRHSIEVLGNKLGKPHYGTKNASAKLDEERVRAIREEYASGTFQYVLAEKYGIKQAHVSAIVRRAVWKHVE